MPAFFCVIPPSDIVSVLDHCSDHTPGALLDMLLEEAQAHHQPHSAAPAVPANAPSATANAISGTATLYCPSLWGASRDEEALQVDCRVKTKAERSLGEGGMGVLT